MTKWRNNELNEIKKQEERQESTFIIEVISMLRE